LTARLDAGSELATEQQRLTAEIRELDLLVESTNTEINRLKSREDQTKARVEEVRADPGKFQREQIFTATDDHATAISRRMTMEGQLGVLQAKRKLLDRVRQLITAAQTHVREGALPPLPADASPVIDEGKLLQAVVDTQEEERKRIARQVHDGPAQAMANVVLQSEISERLFGVDPNRSRTELAALRTMVNKTLQELRGFIFELRPICAHVAVHTLVEPDAVSSVDVFGYHVDFIDRFERRSGRARMVAGTVRVRSRLTEDATALCFAGLHLGEQHVTGGVRPPPDERAWQTIVDELTGALQTADVFAAQRAIDRHFPGAQLSLSSMLPGTREKVLAGVLHDAIAYAEAELASMYDEHAPLMRWLVAHDLPVPDVLHTTAEATLRRRVLANLRAKDASFAQLREHIAEATHVKVTLDNAEIAHAASEGLRRLIDRIERPDGELDATALDTVARAAEVATRMKSAVDLWFAQNATFRLLGRLPELRRRARTDQNAAQQVADLERLARALRIAVPA
jgi:hypothetical protein